MTSSVKRTAGEAGWHKSAYNLMTRVPDSDKIIIANLFKGYCSVYDPAEFYLYTIAESLDEDHPILERFKKRGLIANFDEYAALETMGRMSCAIQDAVTITICTTMGCNFDCPYCFEMHKGRKMSREVQDDVVALAGRMLDAFTCKALHIIWFGGEPLLEPEIVESLSERLRQVAESKGRRYEATILTNGYLLTQEMVDMLARCGVRLGIVSLDGVKETHDATRYLVGGGGTFDKITENLRTLKIPFPVNIRFLQHSKNIDQFEEVEALVEELKEQSGNDYHLAPDVICGNAGMDERGGDVGILGGEVGGLDGEKAVLGNLRKDTWCFLAARGSHCGASGLWSVNVDAYGNLYKCWAVIDSQDGQSFGTAREWDPISPIETASNSDHLTKYLNLAVPIGDPECRKCVWLPLCVGGCLYYRLDYKKECLHYKDTPERYLLSLYDRMLGAAGDS